MATPNPCHRAQVITKFTLSARQALAAKLLMATSAQYLLRHLEALVPPTDEDLAVQIRAAQIAIYDCIVPALAAVTAAHGEEPTASPHPHVSNCPGNIDSDGEPDGAPPLVQVRMLLLGRAGTGKSQVLKALRFFVDQFHSVLSMPVENMVQFCAPTGCAAALLRAQTVHSLIGIGLHTNHRTRTKAAGRDERVAAWSATGLVVVDEVSMVPTPIHDTMGRIIGDLRGKKDTMYGDVSMCWCGDMRQFPPPGMGNQGGRWFDTDDIHTTSKRVGMEVMVSRARHILQSVNAVVILDEGKRFKEPTWDGLLRRLHSGLVTRTDINTLIKRVLPLGSPLPVPPTPPSQAPPLRMLVAWSNHLVHRINNQMVAHAYARLTAAGRRKEFLQLRAIVTHSHKGKVRRSRVFRNPMNTHAHFSAPTDSGAGRCHHTAHCRPFRP